MKFDFTKLFDPNVILVLVHSADVAIERASPDWTKAHHIAATLERLMGQQAISTPTVQSEVPVLQAIGDAVKMAAPEVASAVL